MSDILSLAAQISGNKQTLDKLVDQTATLYKMEIHAVGAYDSGIEHKTTTEEAKKSDKDLLKILDGLPDV